MFGLRTEALDISNLPCHVAIVMDGNGRWAERRGLPRVAGHRAGLAAARTIITESARLGIKFLTLYTFSTENWQRPREEVDFLMRLPEEFWRKEKKMLEERDVRINVLGDIAGLPEATRRVTLEAMSATKDRQGMTVNLALNYGSRAEILRAARLYAERFPDASGDEAAFAQCLYSAGMPDPDLLLRPGGEKRLSNFLLWQAAYAEIVFSDVNWPDYGVKHYHAALVEYQKRNRRRGRVWSRGAKP
ncbi:MAG: di-trans,poly-cis-decaprenylcistransferase [Firmicutes bacterium]|nr:di-trans,poly-cis-decaprenylcistransferase [Dethiobacter sp.]MBS3888677.1 di-trans,poly-cis-decaprenylcistransferase [Bacillota bacterium]